MNKLIAHPISFLIIIACITYSCQGKTEKKLLNNDDIELSKANSEESNEAVAEAPVYTQEVKAVIPNYQIPSDEVVDELYDAIFDKNTEKIIQMLGTKYPAGYEPKNKISPIQALIWNDDNVLIVKMFVEGGAKINKDGDPMILPAAEYKRPKILAYLIEQGCLTEANGTPSPAFNKAGFYQFYEGARLLLFKGADQNNGDVRGKLWFYHEAVAKSDYDALNKLILSKDELNYNDCEGQTALIIAIRKNNLKMVEYLLSKGIDKNIPETFDCGDDIYYGDLPLEIAKKKKNQEIVKVLK